MDLITASGRVGRLTYLATGIAIATVLVVASSAAVTVDEVGGEVQVNPLFVIGSFASIWLGCANAIRRLHDCGHSGWLMLLSLVPVVVVGLGLYLLFAPGDPVRNLYGPPPGRPDRAVKDQLHQQRMGLITAAAGSAYLAEQQASYPDSDGTLDRDGVEAAQEGS